VCDEWVLMQDFKLVAPVVDLAKVAYSLLKVTAVFAHVSLPPRAWSANCNYMGVPYQKLCTTITKLQKVDHDTAVCLFRNIVLMRCQMMINAFAHVCAQAGQWMETQLKTAHAISEVRTHTSREACLYTR